MNGMVVRKFDDHAVVACVAAVLMVTASQSRSKNAGVSSPACAMRENIPPDGRGNGWGQEKENEGIPTQWRHSNHHQGCQRPYAGLRVATLLTYVAQEPVYDSVWIVVDAGNQSMSSSFPKSYEGSEIILWKGEQDQNHS
ncbi:hypothetical protein IV203_024972 [Nitzschia inconspicua]|uniref:Uncharacterized protein n=1 Tax=Nitzschia inconspicua TaxID=303405 RepID=A0A9K3KAD3_9STRA|nr:hypothetical protein IV203_024972 [Nitzschia inconspicua]